MMDIIKGHTTVLACLYDAITKHHYTRGLYIIKLCLKAKTKMNFIVGYLSEANKMNRADTRFMLAHFIKTARFKLTNSKKL